MKLSLATKCQLLFGVAAGIIILAALLVTWQRIEQLTEQHDTTTAATLAKQTLARHARLGRDRDAMALPAFDEYDGMSVREPRLIGLADPDRLTPFEREAVNAFDERPGRDRFASTFTDDAGRSGLRMAMSARNAADCRQCHSGAVVFAVPFTKGRLQSPTESLLPPVVRSPETEGAAIEAEVDAEKPGELLGLVSVEIPSQISTRQPLLTRAFPITAALAAAATATATLYFILTRLILTPVRVLQETAEKVRRGDLNVRATISSGDEFQTLGETINAMVGNLQKQNNQLAKANRTLDDRLGQLAKANVALDESNRLKSEFLANVSHELRTPLNSILGFADLMKSTSKGNDKAVRYAGNIATSGRGLLELINDLLDLAKIEAGRMEVRSSDLSLADLFEALTTLLAPLAAKKQVTIHSQIIPHVPILQTDGGKLQQILYNFLSNAIKFSPDGGRIDLTARRDDGSHVRVTVRDQGPGVAAEQQDVIFEKFRQLDSGVTREHAGTGLGLAISRELASLLGGAIGVESEPGKGATFWLRLPLKREVVPREPRRESRSASERPA